MIYFNRIEDSSEGSSDHFDYRYYEQAGVPFYGNPPLLSENEYDSQTRRLSHAKSGLFDARKPEQRHFGRTFHEVLEGADREEYKIIDQQTFNNGVVNDNADDPPAVFIWLVWFENFDVLRKNVVNHIKRSKDT